MIAGAWNSEGAARQDLPGNLGVALGRTENLTTNRRVFQWVLRDRDPRVGADY